MKKVMTLIVAIAILASLCLTAFADETITVVGNDGDTYYITYCGSDIFLSRSGVKFYLTRVQGEYVSEYGYYFHDGTYRHGTGHEAMDGVTTKVTGNDGDIYYIRNVGNNTFTDYNGIQFFKTAVKGEYRSEFGYFFHDASYVRGTGHDKM